MFWLASFASNVGTWVHEVGSGWLMTTLDGSPGMVSSVRVAMSVPILLLAIPAGAIADRVDRRRLLILVQVVLMLTTATISATTYFNTITPTLLLGLTIVMGLGMVVHVPTWQASIPELVPKGQIPQAVALGSISFNLARSIGPALGGILIAAYGTWVAFALNSLSFAMVIVALVQWKRPPHNVSLHETYGASIKSGVRAVLRDRVMRNVMVRVALFVLPASSLWSLMPLIARDQLDWDSRGYGYLVGAVGVGAVAAAVVLPQLRSKLGNDRTTCLAMCTFAIGLASLATFPSRAVAMLAMLVMGASWMMTLTTLNATAQVSLPNEIRARGMACYLSSLAGAMAVGAWWWGMVASAMSLEFTQLAAAATLPLFATLDRWLPTHSATMAVQGTPTVR